MRIAAVFALMWLSLACEPARADDPLAAGFIPAITFGLAIKSSPVAGPPPPSAPPISYYPPASAPRRGPGRLACWYVPRQVWDGFGFVVTRVRVCG
ncbi:MAG TPA: hypothetical protein VKV77_11890 [Methylovirgula sp.]|nr:hypothetical protein [Methylovirgula sp.]